MQLLFMQWLYWAKYKSLHRSKAVVKFKHRLLQEASEFDDIRLVFGRYLNCSRKEQCRRQIKYIIMDSAPLEGITLKYFLSHIETKSDLTTYLAEYCVKS